MKDLDVIFEDKDEFKMDFMELSKNIQDFNDENQSLIKKIAETKEKIESIFSHKLEKMEQIVKENRLEMVNLVEERDQLKIFSDNQRDIITRTNQEVNQLTEYINKKEVVIEEFRVTLQTMQKENVANVEQIQETMGKEIKHLQETNEKLELLRKHDYKENQKIESDSKQKMTNLRNAHAKEMKETTEKFKESRTTELKQFTKQIDQMNYTNTCLMDEMDKRKEILNQQNSQINQLNFQLNSVQQKFSGFEKDYEDKIDILNKEIERISKKNKRYVNLIEKKNTQLEDSTKQIRKLEIKKSLLSSNFLINSRISEMTMKNKIKDKEIETSSKKTEDEPDVSLDESSTNEIISGEQLEDQEEKEGKIQELKDENKVLLKKIETLENNASEEKKQNCHNICLIKGQLDILKSQKIDLIDDIQKMKYENENLKSKDTESKERMENIIEEIDDLNEKYEKLKIENDSLLEKTVLSENNGTYYFIFKLTILFIGLFSTGFVLMNK